jgi:sulfonate transport system substrate-binding protein
MNDTRKPKAPLIFLIPAVVLILTTVIFVLLYSCDSDKPAVPPEKITIAYSAIVDTTLVQVAHKQGYYLQEGLDAIMIPHSHGKAALGEALSGKADFATVAETPVIFAVMHGEKITIIATIQASKRNNAILARKERRILTPLDLKGKNIGVTLGTTADFFMHAFLIAHGISRNDIKVVNLNPEEMPHALASGNVDAVSAFHPYLHQAQKNIGDRGIIFYDEDIYTQTFNIVASQDFVNKNPDKIKKFLRALIRAEDFVRQNPEEAQKIVADTSGIDAGIVREVWADNSFGVALDQTLLLAMEDESQWAIKNRLTDTANVPNYLNFIYLEGLQAVKPAAVRILR